MKQLPTLPGLIGGIVGDDVLGWTVQCRECGDTATHPKLVLAIMAGGMRFHHGDWPDGTNPRLCRDCRQKRGWSCAQERKGTHR